MIYMKEIPAKTIVTRTKHASAWFGTDYTMNLYRGCNHGCIYCDSRSACYGTQNFDEVCAKADALRIVRDDLRRKSKAGVVGTGAMSDPYNPFERGQQLTRHALELLSAYGFGVAIATKSDLVTRDIDVLREIMRFAPVLVKITLTTTDDALARIIEPHAPAPSARLAALAALSAAGIPTCILLMPVLPFITDSAENLTAIVAAASKAGVPYIFPGFGVTMRENQREYYYRQLDTHFPGLKAAYIKRYGTRYHCAPPRVSVLYHAFGAACNRHGIVFQMNEIIRGYKSPYQNRQLTFLE